MVLVVVGVLVVGGLEVDVLVDVEELVVVGGCDVELVLVVVGFEVEVLDDVDVVVVDVLVVDVVPDPKVEALATCEYAEVAPRRPTARTR